MAARRATAGRAGRHRRFRPARRNCPSGQLVMSRARNAAARVSTSGKPSTAANAMGGYTSSTTRAALTLLPASMASRAASSSPVARRAGSIAPASPTATQAMCAFRLMDHSPRVTAFKAHKAAGLSAGTCHTVRNRGVQRVCKQKLTPSRLPNRFRPRNCCLDSASTLRLSRVRTPARSGSPVTRFLAPRTYCKKPCFFTAFGNGRPTPDVLGRAPRKTCALASNQMVR